MTLRTDGARWNPWQLFINPALQCKLGVTTGQQSRNQVNENLSGSWCVTLTVSEDAGKTTQPGDKRSGCWTRCKTRRRYTPIVTIRKVIGLQPYYSGVGTSVVHGMSVLVRVQTPEPIRSSTGSYKWNTNPLSRRD